MDDRDDMATVAFPDRFKRVLNAFIGAQVDNLQVADAGRSFALFRSSPTTRHERANRSTSARPM